MKLFLKYYLPLNLLFDILTNTLFQSSQNLATTRGVILLLIFFISWLMVYRNKIFIPFIIYSIYILILIYFSSDVSESLKQSSKFLTTIWAFPIFYCYGYLYTEKVIIRNVLLLSIILIINYYISTIFNLGISEYSGGTEFLVGSLSDSWLIYTYILFTYIIIIKTKNLSLASKIAFIVMFSFLTVQLILGLKRTAIGVFFLGIIIYLILERLNFRSILFYTLGLIIIAFFLNQYSDILETRLYARSNQISGKYQDIIISEYRYLETIYVWNKTLSFENVGESLFGLEPFNSGGNYDKTGFFGDRRLHVDYNKIVNTTGLFGLILYFYIFFYIFRIFWGKRKYLEYKYKELFLIIFITQFIASFGGQMLLVTYGSIKFLLMGIALNKYE